MVRLLLHFGADPLQRDSRGITPNDCMGEFCPNRKAQTVTRCLKNHHSKIGLRLEAELGISCGIDCPELQI